jgi:hypothetical protein
MLALFSKNLSADLGINLVRKVCVFLKKIDPEGKGIDQTEVTLSIFCRQKIGL